MADERYFTRDELALFDQDFKYFTKSTSHYTDPWLNVIPSTNVEDHRAPRGPGQYVTDYTRTPGQEGPIEGNITSAVLKSSPGTVISEDTSGYKEQRF